MDSTFQRWIVTDDIVNALRRGDIAWATFNAAPPVGTIDLDLPGPLHYPPKPPTMRASVLLVHKVSNRHHALLANQPQPQ